MASVRKEIPIDARCEDVWAAIRDFGAVHRRVVPGFVVDLKLEADARIVTFANGSVARELLVDIDDEARRLVYAIVSERVKHYNASVQVFADGEQRSRIVWTIDLLPNEIAGYVRGQVDEAAGIMQQTLGRAASG
jgi:hypothetical protein